MPKLSMFIKIICVASVWLAMIGIGNFTSPVYSFPRQQTVPAPPISTNCAFDPWQRTTSLIEERVGFAAVQVNDYIYALGGSVFHNDSRYPYVNTIERTKINSDGTLDAWQILSSTMNIPRAFFGAVATDNYIYVIGGTGGTGGNSGQAVLNSVERAAINEDGTLSNWQTVNSMTTERNAVTGIIIGDYLYAIGSSDTGISGFERAAINEDASLGDWQVMPGEAKNSIAVATNNRYIYAIGGYNAGVLLNIAEYAKINTDGSLDSWQTTTPMNTQRNSHAAMVINNYLYAIGGSRIGPLSSIERAEINADGTLGTWQLVNSMTTGRQGLKTVAIGEYLYALGGASDTDPVNTVEWAKISDLGIPPDYRVSIKEGTLFTNQTAVTLTINAVLGTTEMQVSNDGGFAGAQWEPCIAIKEWEITKFGSYVIPRVVYTRFKDKNGNVSPTFQDDIILDVTPPSGSVTIVAPAGVSAANTSVILTLKATDDVSGVGEMIISGQTDFADASWQPFQASATWSPDNSRSVYVKFRDNAGNRSEVYSASVTGAAAIYMSLIQR